MNKKVDNLFQQFNKTTPGCSVCVIQNGKIVLEECYGLADVEKSISITPDTAFRLASLTKPFTAMAIMILKQRGQLTFDDTLSKFFPDFPEYGKNITIRQLLTHTSGMPDHEQPLYRRIKPGEEPTIYDALQVLKHEKQLLFAPGSKYTYSDAGFVILALIIERVLGQKYADFLTQNIFIPLDMKDTIVLDETKPVIKNRAFGYRNINNKYKLYDYDPLNYIVGDEGIYSTIEDLAKWKVAWTTDVLVSKSMLSQAFQPQRLPNGQLGKCGFSWFIQNVKNEKVVFQDGYWVGFNNIMLTDIEKDKTVIVLSNTTAFPTEKERVKTAINVLDFVNN